MAQANTNRYPPFADNGCRPSSYKIWRAKRVEPPPNERHG